MHNVIIWSLESRNDQEVVPSPRRSIARLGATGEGLHHCNKKDQKSKPSHDSTRPEVPLVTERHDAQIRSSKMELTGLKSTHCSAQPF